MRGGNNMNATTIQMARDALKAAFEASKLAHEWAPNWAPVDEEPFKTLSKFIDSVEREQK